LEAFFQEEALTESVKEKAGKAGKKVKEMGNKIANVMKQAAGKSANWISKKISAFRNLMDKLLKRGQYEPGIKGVVNKVIAKIKQAIDFLSRQLKKATNKFK
jgi:hypothetical protein